MAMAKGDLILLVEHRFHKLSAAMELAGGEWAAAWRKHQNDEGEYSKIAEREIAPLWGKFVRARNRLLKYVAAAEKARQRIPEVYRCYAPSCPA